MGHCSNCGLASDYSVGVLQSHLEIMENEDHGIGIYSTYSIASHSLHFVCYRRHHLVCWNLDVNHYLNSTKGPSVPGSINSFGINSSSLGNPYKKGPYKFLRNLVDCPIPYMEIMGADRPDRTSDVSMVFGSSSEHIWRLGRERTSPPEVFETNSTKNECTPRKN